MNAILPVVNYGVCRRCGIARRVNVGPDLLAKTYPFLRARGANVNLSHLLPSASAPSKFARISC